MPKDENSGKRKSEPKPRKARRSGPLPAASPPAPPEPVREPDSLLSELDLHLFHEGSHFQIQEKLGAHPGTRRGERGCFFGVFAPSAAAVSVMGDFNGWDKEALPLATRGSGGIWEGFIPGVGPGAVYKFHIVSRHRGYRVDKADPFGFRQEPAPGTASIVQSLDFSWDDAEWMAARPERQKANAPVSVYEVHLGSWRRGPGGRMLTYRELAVPLADYVRSMGFTHVEFLPVMEHPFYGSWGYQVTGYFAPSARQGEPEEFRALVEHMHRSGIGVLLDWVPSHFPTDEHGLGYFDGTHLYEHADPRQGFHPDWKSAIFNYGRNEVRSFLISNALFWIEKYHADGLRVDGVASMLHLDYSREPGEWIPNAYGGRENLDAIAFLRRLNDQVFEKHPDVLTIAEESTSWPMVTRPTRVGGLGFRMKWDMGWMNDTLEYLELDPVLRSFNHGLLTFRPMYAYTENFMLPLSHDEVVHRKGSLLNKMPGDPWKKFANLRLLLGYQAAVPGKKLLFMGGEIGQWAEWDHDSSIQWHLLGQPGGPHDGVQRWVRDLNRLGTGEPALHELDFHPAGFEWVDFRDSPQSVIAFLRLSSGGEAILAVFNFTPVPRRGYRIGVPRAGAWRVLANGDASQYGGSGVGENGSEIQAEGIPHHGRPFSIRLDLPPLAAIFWKGPPAPAAPDPRQPHPPTSAVTAVAAAAPDVSMGTAVPEPPADVPDAPFPDENPDREAR